MIGPRPYHPVSIPDSATGKTQRSWGRLVTSGQMCTVYVSKSPQLPYSALVGLLEPQLSPQSGRGPLCPPATPQDRTRPPYSLSALILGQLHVILHPETITQAQGREPHTPPH